MAKVVLENVYKIYPGDVTAVHDANLEIQDQEFVLPAASIYEGTANPVGTMLGKKVSGDAWIEQAF